MNQDQTKGDQCPGRACRFAAGLFGIIGVLALGALPARSADMVEYNRDIRPILSENCYYCHGPDPKHREADLRLDIRDAALANEAFIPGNPDESELVIRILSDDAFEKMPPPKT